MRQLKITKQVTNRETASLDKYLQEIGKVDLITADEEVELAQRIKAGDLVFTVLMNSPENKALQDFANHFQELAFDSTQLVVPIQAKLKDNMGKDECLMTNGVVLAMPAMSRGQTMNTVTWVITFEKVDFTRDSGKDVQPISGSF